MKLIGYKSQTSIARLTLEIPEWEVHCEADRLSETGSRDDPDSETRDVATTLEVEADSLVKADA